MDVFMGSIMTFGFQFAPAGWQPCNGQTLNVQQYNALFALIGITYGGNGSQNFMLPNLQGRMPIGQGNGANLTPRVLGTPGGTENVTLLTSNMPSHTHVATFTPSGGGGSPTLQVQGTPTGITSLPAPTTGAYLAAAPTGGQGQAAIWSATMPNPVTIGGLTGGGSGGGTVTNALTGSGLPTGLMNPFLVLNFSIALQGLFPSRN